MFIPWNTNTQNITVSTVSEVGSMEKVYVVFYDKDGNDVGRVGIYFYTSIHYQLGLCTNATAFPTLPAEKQKTWIIRYDSTEQRVVLHCNEVEELNVLLSSECTRSEWRVNWEKETTQIKFASERRPSYSYCFSSSSNPGNGEFWEV